jgi:KDO2-lipid IV(A) lauroyltransferase
MHPVPLGRAARDLIRHLKNGDLVALLADRDFTTHRRRVPFFGEPANLVSGPARLALITGAPILPVFLVRNVDDTFIFRFRDPLFPEKYKTEGALQQQITQILEEEISEVPSQWFVFEDFWRKNPET